MGETSPCSTNSLTARVITTRPTSKRRGSGLAARSATRLSGAGASSGPASSAGLPASGSPSLVAGVEVMVRSCPQRGESGVISQARITGTKRSVSTRVSVMEPSSRSVNSVLATLSLWVLPLTTRQRPLGAVTTPEIAPAASDRARCQEESRRTGGRGAWPVFPNTLPASGQSPCSFPTSSASCSASSDTR